MWGADARVRGNMDIAVICLPPGNVLWLTFWSDRRTPTGLEWKGSSRTEIEPTVAVGFPQTPAAAMISMSRNAVRRTVASGNGTITTGPANCHAMVEACE